MNSLGNTDKVCKQAVKHNIHMYIVSCESVYVPFTYLVAHEDKQPVLCSIITHKHIWFPDNA